MEDIKIFSQPRAEYGLITKSNAVYLWSFPTTATLEDNLEMIQYLEKEVAKAIAEKKSKEAEVKEDTKEV